MPENTTSESSLGHPHVEGNGLDELAEELEVENPTRPIDVNRPYKNIHISHPTKIQVGSGTFEESVLSTIGGFDEVISIIDWGENTLTVLVDPEEQQEVLENVQSRLSETFNYFTAAHEGRVYEFENGFSEDVFSKRTGGDKETSEGDQSLPEGWIEKKEEYREEYDEEILEFDDEKKAVHADSDKAKTSESEQSESDQMSSEEGWKQKKDRYLREHDEEILEFDDEKKSVHVDSSLVSSNRQGSDFISWQEHKEKVLEDGEQ